MRSNLEPVDLMMMVGTLIILSWRDIEVAGKGGYLLGEFSDLEKEPSREFIRSCAHIEV